MHVITKIMITIGYLLQNRDKCLNMDMDYVPSIRIEKQKNEERRHLGIMQLVQLVGTVYQYALQSYCRFQTIVSKENIPDHHKLKHQLNGGGIRIEEDEL